MITHRFSKRVRYGETDQMGYLYYGNYPQYYEIGRAEMMRQLGMTYKEMEEEKGGNDASYLHSNALCASRSLR